MSYQCFPRAELLEGFTTKCQEEHFRAVIELFDIFIVTVIISINLFLETHENCKLFISKCYCVKILCHIPESPSKGHRGWHYESGNWEESFCPLQINLNSTEKLLLHLCYRVLKKKKKSNSNGRVHIIMY